MIKQKLAVSTKRMMIDQANARVVVLTSVAAFVLVFCAVSTKTLLGQASYQNKVIAGKKVAVQQLKTDIGAVQNLKTSYDAFVSTSQNVLKGNSTGNGPKDGDNAKIVLDALPSSYDFPALTTSLEALITSQQLKIGGITGTDDQLAQATNTSSSTPVPSPIPFQVSVSGGYANIQGLVDTFQKSIRPVQLQTLEISGDQSNLAMTINAQTYYQPAKSLNIKSEVQK